MAGVFVLSLDEELLWGVIHRSDRDYFKWGVSRQRIVLMKMLALLKKYNIKATFAIVGHMMLSACNDKSCACKLLSRNYFFGRDIISKVRMAGHEIGIHGFTHKFFDELNDNDANRELSMAVSAAKSIRVRVKSIVYPQNRVAHKNLLSKYGIIAYRGPDPWWFNSLPPMLQKPAHLIDYVFAVPPPVSKVIREGKNRDLSNVPGSMFFLARDGFRKLIPMKCRVLKAKKGIDKAVREEKIFHLWFHPFNLSWDSDKMLAGLEEIFKYAGEKRRQGVLRVMTMQEAARL